jgi:hypothetical protein
VTLHGRIQTTETKARALYLILVADLREHLTPIVQRSLLGVGDQLLRVRPLAG